MLCVIETDDTLIIHADKNVTYILSCIRCPVRLACHTYHKLGLLCDNLLTPFSKVSNGPITEKRSFWYAAAAAYLYDNLMIKEKICQSIKYVV